MSTSQTTCAATPLDDVQMAARPSVGWRLHPSVAVRREAFGALLYHFGTRRLTFVKDRQLVEALTQLDRHPSVEDAYRAAGVPPERWTTFDAALQRLADTHMLRRGDNAEVTD